MIAGVLAGLAGATAEFWFDLSPDVSFEPASFYNPQDPFSQQFSVTNEGPLTIYKLFSACSISSLTLNSGVQIIPKDEIVTMFPVENDVLQLLPHEKTNENCYFNSTLGSKLNAINLELDVFFKITSFGLSRRATQKFTAVKIQSTPNIFTWNYGSPDESFFEKPLDGKRRLTIIIPYGGPIFPGNQDE